MKRLILAFILLFNLIPYQTPVYAAGPGSDSSSSVYDAIHDGGEKTPAAKAGNVDGGSSSFFSIIMKFLGSLVLVVLLIIGLYWFVAKKGRRLNSAGPVLQLAGHAVGPNRSIQVVLIGQTIYILGVGEDITLIRTITKGEEYQQLLESYENQADQLAARWPVKDMKLNWNSIFQKHLKKMEDENQKETDRW